MVVGNNVHHGSGNMMCTRQCGVVYPRHPYILKALASMS